MHIYGIAVSLLLSYVVLTDISFSTVKESARARSMLAEQFLHDDDAWNRKDSRHHLVVDLKLITFHLSELLHRFYNHDY